MIKMHVAASGERAGEYVPCPARFSCRLAAPEEHLFFESTETAEEYNELQLAEQYGVSGEFTVKSKERMREIEQASEDHVQSIKDRARKAKEVRARVQSEVSYKRSSSSPKPVEKPTPQALDSLNPTGSVFVKYRPEERVKEVSENLAPLSETMGMDPNEEVAIYRGVPKGVQGEIVAGDFVTTNRQLAQDYAGTGDVLEMFVKAGEVLDDREDPGGEEYLYRPDLMEDSGRE